MDPGIHASCEVAGRAGPARAPGDTDAAAPPVESSQTTACAVDGFATPTGGHSPSSIGGIRDPDAFVSDFPVRMRPIPAIRPGVSRRRQRRVRAGVSAARASAVVIAGIPGATRRSLGLCCCIQAASLATSACCNGLLAFTDRK